MLCAGLLLRLFHLLYNCDVAEEEVYHSWKEDFAQDFPGKEKALFQVRESLGWEGESRNQGMGGRGEPVCVVSTCLSCGVLFACVRFVKGLSIIFYSNNTIFFTCTYVLPQVNQWLNLLAEASEKESEED